MPLNDKLARSELLLPNIILFNQMFAEAQRINGQSKRTESEERTRLPCMQATNEPGNDPNYSSYVLVY